MSLSTDGRVTRKRPKSNQLRVVVPLFKPGASGDTDVRIELAHRGYSSAECSHISFAIRVHPITQKDYEHFGRRIDPGRGSCKSCVTKRAERKTIAPVCREVRVDVPTKTTRPTTLGHQSGTDHRRY